MDIEISGLGTINLIKGAFRKIYGWVPIMAAIDPNGNPRALSCDINGNIQTTESTTAASVTSNFVNVGSGASGTIPVGAKGWTFSLTSGTGTFGNAGTPYPIQAGFSDSDPGVVAVAINYTTGANSEAYLRYGS